MAKSVVAPSKVKEVKKGNSAKKSDRSSFRDPRSLAFLTAAPALVTINADGSLAAPVDGQFSPALHKPLNVADFGQDKVLFKMHKADLLAFRGAKMINSADRMRARATEDKVAGNDKTKKASGKLTRVLAQAVEMEEMLKAELGDEFEGFMANVREKAAKKAADKKAAEAAEAKK